MKSDLTGVKPDNMWEHGSGQFRGKEEEFCAKIMI